METSEKEKMKMTKKGDEGRGRRKREGIEKRGKRGETG